jgi:hypothetical protein
MKSTGMLNRTALEGTPVTIAERSKLCTVFARSEAGIGGSNPTYGMDVWFVYVFILCLCYPVFRQRLCDGLITRPRSPTVFKIIKKIINQPYAPNLSKRKKKNYKERRVYGVGSLSGGWTPAGFTRHGGHSLAYCVCLE